MEKLIPLSRYVGPGERLVIVRREDRMRVLHIAARLPGGRRDLTSVAAQTLRWPLLDGRDLNADRELEFAALLIQAVPLFELDFYDIGRGKQRCNLKPIGNLHDPVNL